MLNNEKKYQEYVVLTRRHLHENPEIGFDINETINFIAQELDKLNVKYYKNIGISSLVAVIEGNNKTPVIGFRADVDALEIQEMNDVSYKSKIDGRMHACGHDAHTAILLTLIKYIVEEKVQINGTLKFIFQAAEEGPTSGGELVCKDKLMDDVDVFLAIHVNPMIPSKKIGIKSGEFNASCDDFVIKLIGKSGHAAYPSYSIDPIQMGVEVYTLIQNMKARELDPLEKSVISVCVFEAGSAFNIIPDCCYLKGTVRTYSKTIKDKIKTKLFDIVKSVTTLHNGSYEIDYQDGVIPTINTVEVCEYLKKIVINTFGNDSFYEITTPSMGVDDFAYYIDLKKGAMVCLGTKNEKKFKETPLHNSHFNIDEDSMLVGVEFYLESIKNWKK